jgi:dCMP deaminase
MSKRKDYISWNEYFMEIALLSAKRSKDPSTQVGACIVNDENKIVGIGYNGLPNGISDDDLTWERNGCFLDTKYAYVCHAEMNAIMNCTQLPKGCTIYVTLFPCNECAKLIIQSGIKKVIYLENKYKDSDSVKASTILMEKSGVEFCRYNK